MSPSPRSQLTARLLEQASRATSAARRADLEERVIRTNMTIAAQIAARYRGRGIPSDDLEQVAYLGLVKAVRGYEYAADRDFLSYAVPTIRGEVQRHFRDLGWMIRPTRAVQTSQARISQAEAELLQALGRSPRPSEIAAHLDLEVELVVEALSANGCFTPSSLDADNPAEGAGLGAFLGECDPGFGRVETRLVLGPLVARLSERERLLLDLRFFHLRTQAEIGEVLGVTQMQVSRLLSSLMARLRSELETADEALVRGSAA